MLDQGGGFATTTAAEAALSMTLAQRSPGLMVGPLDLLEPKSPALEAADIMEGQKAPSDQWFVGASIFDPNRSVWLRRSMSGAKFGLD